VLVAAATPIGASATTVRALSLQAMSADAEVIAVGHCVSIESAWEARTLVTRATVQVTESIKGDLGESIVVTLPGGVDANRRFPVAMTYPGAPSMQPGEQVFLFLDQEEADPSALTVSGFAQGKYTIESDGSGTQYVTRDLSGLALIDDAGAVAGAKSVKTLAEFRRDVLVHLGR
jgi:hypothetical protein